MTVGLVYSEIRAAAQAVADEVGPLQTTLETLGGDLESAATGFTGQAAVGFGEAISAWFEVAETLGPILEGYAHALVGVAQDHATNDTQQAERYGRISDRLGGAQ